MKPILFNTEMVQAILDGRKTVTRRVVKNLSFHEVGNGSIHVLEIHNGDEEYPPVFGGPIDFVNANAVYYAPYQKGDLLYVRETWAQTTDLFGEFPQYIYRADYSEMELFPSESAEEIDTDFPACVKWRPSIHMPKEAARIFLRVTDVRVERLQDITEEQAISEGFNLDMQICGQNRTLVGSAKQAFMWTWQRLYDNDIKCCWVANPWVWVIEFERCTKEGVPYVK